ncbi:QWRF motif-containing protein 2-like [Salvia hispanica]|uniref:QWRF motif-containing protein 2-like n=1 Tax=Salvia hispanica TaxID=49212 RepID=UPI002009BBA2|nr:QWRF motif-containing protein 2-like [Salvia hispanica]XP_047957435.1 QWRF motif-containing protein 2-like [Salvia hispanica]XP_047957442.1 QWRF motif-containing protein 2-like [Salvia hispanica]
MVTAVASTPKQQRPSQIPKRPPLLPSDSDNAPPRRPRAREVTSRYLSLSTTSSSSSSNSNTTSSSSSVTSGSSISSRRSQSPILGTAISTPRTQQRAVSAERRRPLATAATPTSAEKMLVRSVRSLSVSFQGQSYSLPVSKVKPPPAAVGTPGVTRKGTPERRKAGVTPVRDRTVKDRDTPRPIEQQQHLWPGRLRSENPSLMSRSLDYGADRANWNRSSPAISGLRKSVDSELKLDDSAFSDGGRSRLGGSLNSDVESVSSEGTVSGDTTQLRGMIVPARCWQEASNRVQRVVDPASPLSNRINASSKLIVAKRFQTDSPVSSPREIYANRGPSPLRGGNRAASPSRAMTSGNGALPRGMASPIRARNGTGNDNSMVSTPSLISFPIELRRGKFGENRIADAHELRMLYNRQLQWRLANAKVENAILVQKHAAERHLYNAWVNTSKLRHSVSSKRIELQSLRLNLKLYSMLKDQEPHLETWGMLDRDYWNSVSGAIKALEASTLRLPIVDGARADVHKVQEAIHSAVDVMQAMESSIYSLQLKVERMNSLATELSKLSSREYGLLTQCKDLFSTTFIPLQVINWSLNVQVQQVQCSQERFSKET